MILYQGDSIGQSALASGDQQLRGTTRRSWSVCMASDLWSSGHSEFLVHREALHEAHAGDRQKGLTAQQIEEINVFIVLYIEGIAKTSQNLIRQRVAGSACVLFRRFYLKKDFCEYDPRHVGPVCLYLACKAEESQIQAKVLLQMLRKVHTIGKYSALPMPEPSQFLDLEMAVLEALDFNLIVCSPYKDLTMSISAASANLLAECAWAVMNDSYRSDVSLVHPPHMIAMACLVVSSVLMKHNIQDWLKLQSCDLNEVLEISTELMCTFKSQRGCISAESCNRYLEFLK